LLISASLIRNHHGVYFSDLFNDFGSALPALREHPTVASLDVRDNA